MGTRHLTVFHDSEFSKKEIVVLYGQWDGYPSGHGLDLCEFLMNKKMVNGIPCGENETKTKMFNGIGCLSASVVSHFKGNVGSFYLYPAKSRNHGEEFIYHVRGFVGKEPEIKIEDITDFLPASKMYEYIKNI